MSATGFSTTTATSPIGPLLRDWRSARRLSQLALALEAGVSARHLSCVENGKAQPSRALLDRLADALALPLRERNAMLLAGGYAPAFPETPLQGAGMAPMRQAIDGILRQQEPYPAFLLDRHWNILLANAAAARVTRHVMGGRESRHTNMVRMVFDPDDLRPSIANWEEIAADLVRHLHRVIAVAPTDTIARGLLAEALAQPGVPSHWRSRDSDRLPSPVLSTVLRREDEEFRFFSTITTFGTPRDVTLDELHIECSFPLDEATAERCRRLAAASREG